MRAGGLRSYSLLALFCMALLIAVGTAQLVHTHAAGHSDHDCALCYSAHQSVQATAQVVIQYTTHAIADIIFVSKSDRPCHNVILLPVNRPPPAVPVVA